MAHMQPQHGAAPLRLRAVAALLLALFFGMQAAPLAQAQSASGRDCCMAAEGKGCSMHLHRAARAAEHTFAALQPLCPCAATAPAPAAPHHVLAFTATHLFYADAQHGAVPAGVSSWSHSRSVRNGTTRGPPEVNSLA